MKLPFNRLLRDNKLPLLITLLRDLPDLLTLKKVKLLHTTNLNRMLTHRQLLRNLTNPSLIEATRTLHPLHLLLKLLPLDMDPLLSLTQLSVSTHLLLTQLPLHLPLDSLLLDPPPLHLIHLLLMAHLHRPLLLILLLLPPPPTLLLLNHTHNQIANQPA